MEPCVRPGQTSHKPPPASHTIQHQHTTTTGLENFQNAADSLGRFEPHQCQTQQATCLHSQHRPSTFQHTSNPSPSQVLEQLAQSLQSQSLAVKRRSEWSNYLNHNYADEAMEVDPMAEDVMQDPFIQSQKLSALYHKARYPRDRIPREVFEAQRMAKGLDEEQQRSESSPLTLHAQQRDGMDTNGDSDESARHIPTTSPRGPNTLIVEDDPNAQLGPELLLSYRRSAHVATRNPYVVQKATRMRKRVKTSAHTRRLPHKGDKGKAVANELESSTLPDK